MVPEMDMIHRKFLFFAIFFCSAAGMIFAHHSGALYDLTKTGNVSGTVKVFLWSNPHVVLMVAADANGDQASKEWRFEMTSPGRLTRSGYTKRMIQPGDKVTVEYSPMRDGSRLGWVRKITLSDGKVLDLGFQDPEKPNLP